MEDAYEKIESRYLSNGGTYDIVFIEASRSQVDIIHYTKKIRQLLSENRTSQVPDTEKIPPYIVNYVDFDFRLSEDLRTAGANLNVNKPIYM